MQAHILNSLVKSSLDAIVCGDSTGRITLFNPAAVLLFGYSETEALGQPFTLLARKQDRAVHQLLFQRLLRTGKSRLLGEHREVYAQHKAGRIFPVRISLAMDQVDGEYIFTTIMHDITERRFYENKLLQFHNIVASSSDAMALLDRNFVYQAVNPAYLKLTNNTADEVEGKTPADILGQEIFEKTIKPNALRCMTGEICKFQQWFTFPGTGRRYIRVYYYPYQDTAGVIRGFVMNGRDITSRHQIEKSLARKQGQLSALLKASLEINHTLDPISIRKTLITIACQLLDCDAGAAGMMEEENMVFREYYQKLRWQKPQWIPLDYSFAPGVGVPGHVLTSKKPYISNDAKHDTHVAAEIRQKLNFHQLIDVPILSRNDKVLGCFEIHDRRDGEPFQQSDIDILNGLAASAAVALENSQLLEGKKRLIDNLAEKEEQIRHLFESANDAILLLDLQQRQLIEVNQQACELLGYSHEEFQNMPMQDILPYNTDLLEDFIQTTKTVGSNRSDQLAFISRQGRVIPSEVSASVLKYADKCCLLAIVHDITERNMHEQQLHTSLEGTILAVCHAIEARDPYTAGHELRVATLAFAIGKKLNLNRQQLEGIRLGALIHDIGKIQLPAEILSKPTKLTALEYGLIQYHPGVGYDILKDIDFPWPIADIAHQHHERLDGSGYPQGLENDSICLEARVVAVADVVEAMASHRPYRPALGIDKALSEILRGRDTLYDKTAVDACLALFKNKTFSFDESAQNHRWMTCPFDAIKFFIGPVQTPSATGNPERSHDQLL